MAVIWLAVACLALVAMGPLAWSLRGTRGVGRSRREAALELHRAQLVELDRDLEQGRIGAPEHATARLEVQRRLLGEAALVDPEGRATRAPLLITLALVPVAAVLLYLPGSAPNMPAMPLAGRIATARQEAAQAETLIAQLHAKIATLDPKSDPARQGYVLLGNMEDTRGNLAAAADAWQQALTIRFDPDLAAQVAEAHSRLDGTVSAASAALFRQALAAAPADAPWRSIAEQRLQQPAGTPLPAPQAGDLSGATAPPP